MERLVDWDHDAAVLERILAKFGSRGTYMGRHLILMDTPIDGGVLVGKNSREAIIVDSTGPEVQKLYQRTLELLADPRFTGLYAPEAYPEAYSSAEERQIGRTLWAVYRVVSDAFSPPRAGRQRKQKPFNPERAVDALVTELAAWGDKQVPLDVFIERGAGVCRQNASAAGVLLEMLIKGGYISGEVSVDRNTVNRVSHAWARYTTPTGHVWIVDPAQPLICSQLDHVATIEGAWSYQRPDDILSAPR